MFIEYNLKEKIIYNKSLSITLNVLLYLYKKHILITTFLELSYAFLQSICAKMNSDFTIMSFSTFFCLEWSCLNELESWHMWSKQFFIFCIYLSTLSSLFLYRQTSIYLFKKETEISQNTFFVWNISLSVNMISGKTS